MTPLMPNLRKAGYIFLEEWQRPNHFTGTEVLHPGCILELMWGASQVLITRAT